MDTYAGIIDVYHGDKFANSWPTDLRDAGVCACILKATQSNSTVDPMYDARRRAMRSCGFKTGSYHFGTSVGQAADQAKFYLGTAKPGPDELVCLDWECHDPDGLPSDLDMTVAHAEHFVSAVFDALGRWPVLYMNLDWLNVHKPQMTRLSPLVQCPWWIARYSNQAPDKLPFKKDWTLWQYSDKAQTKGVINPCDRSRFNGNKDLMLSTWPL